MNKQICFFATLIFCGVAMAEHTRAWQMGKVVDSEANRYVAGSSGRLTPDNNTGTVGTSTQTDYGIEHDYTITTEEFAYVAHDWSLRYPPLVVNSTIKFAVDGRWIYVIGENGKERKMVVAKKVKK